MDGGIFWPKMAILLLPHLISAQHLPIHPSGKITRDKKQDRISGAPFRRFTPLILVQTLRSSSFFSGSSQNLSSAQFVEKKAGFNGKKCRFRWIGRINLRNCLKQLRRS
ncbi:unnamed protein product [Lactuca virosa]|uniref:Secreted protein n=1 Tax=Lactuca virosa TaxID=75947 RepID=A0AAU9P7S4_9ASTR|nr:unnamed protein product [Lactuca virosa]